MDAFLSDDFFKTYVHQKHPEFASALDHPSYTPFLCSPHAIPISRHTVTQIETVVRALEKIRTHPHYPETLLSQTENQRLIQPKNRSVYMGYDFFVSEDGIRLIEINTNAAGALIVALLNDYQGGSGFNDQLQIIAAMFESEWHLAGGTTPPAYSLIVDEDVTTQRSYCDFLLNQILFHRMGWRCDIADVNALVWNGTDQLLQVASSTDKYPVSFVYNRSCDFELTTPQSQALYQAWHSGTVCVSPHPFDYVMLSDKRRLAHFSDAAFIDKFGLTAEEKSALLNAIPPVVVVRKQDSEWLWSNRKHLFFKPAQSFGSKAAYNGQRITTKMFDYVLNQNYIAQPTFETPLFNGFKYDLRAYVYQGHVQQIGARLFRGQTMNFQTPGGGFAGVTIQ